MSICDIYSVVLEIIVYEIPPWGKGSVSSSRSSLLLNRIPRFLKEGMSIVLTDN